MSLFHRTRPAADDLVFEPPSLEYKTSANVGQELEPLTFEPKPDELTHAVQRAQEWTRVSTTQDWTRAVEAPGNTPSVPWSNQAPMVPGLYWWRPAPLTTRALGLPRGEASLCVVTTFGGSLVVRRRKGDSSSYTSVGALAREWAGPIAIPADAELDDFREVN